MTPMRTNVFTIVILLITTASPAQKIHTSSNNTFKKKKLLYHDDFNNNVGNWVVETPPSENSEVSVRDGTLLIDVENGATVWFNKKLRGNIMIEYTRTVVMKGGRNDRLSDFNMFWMANDPRNKNLFTRTGIFQEYDSLLLYYVGIGGNTNTTTRFRKYEGNGTRKLHLEHLDNRHLLLANKEYRIQIIVYKGASKVIVDGEEYFSFTDPDPIPEGYFGFRTVQSRQVIDDFKVYQLK